MGFNTNFHGVESSLPHPGGNAWIEQLTGEPQPVGGEFWPTEVDHTAGSAYLEGKVRHARYLAIGTAVAAVAVTVVIAIGNRVEQHLMQSDPVKLEEVDGQ